MTDINYWLVKWIVLPFMISIVLIGLFANSSSIDRCEAACQKQGYADFKHKAAPRLGSSSCYCLTEEQIPDKDKYSIIGVKVF